MQLTRIEQASNHADTAVLDISRLGIFFIVNEVLREGLSHELFGFVFLSDNSAYVPVMHPTLDVEPPKGG